MSQDTWKLENDLCRCCHSEGTYLCLSETHEEDGEEFSYSNLLRETLDIDLTPMEGPLSMKTFTICYICILQLRNAVQFKKQVLMREERFKVMFSKIEVSIEDIKKEIIISDDDAMSDAVDFNNDDFQLDNPVKVEVPLLVPKEEKRRERQVRKVKPKVTTVVKKPKRTARAKKNKVETEMEGGAMADEDAASKENNSKEDPKNSTIVKCRNRRKFKCTNCHSMVFFPKNHRCRYRTTRKRTHMNEEYDTGEYKINGKIFLRVKQKNNCDYCNKQLLNEDSMRSHITHHHKLRKCPECSLMITEKEMAIHKAEIHGIKRPTCGVCGYTADKEGLIVSHQRNVHMKEKNVPCPLCDQSFFSQVRLTQHMIKHNPVKKYECTHCKKKFPRRATLQMHKKIHTGEKNKVCTICDERFVQKASLNYHMAKHHPEAC